MEEQHERTVASLSSFIAFVTINLLTVICCLPVVTIGASVAALMETMLAVMRDEDTDMVTRWWRSWRGEWKRSTAVTFFLAVPALLCCFATRFWWQLDGGLATGVALTTSFAALCLSAGYVQALVLVATRRSNARCTARNGLQLVFYAPARSALIVAMPLAAAALCVVFPPLVFLLATCGCGIIALFQARIAVGIHARLS